VALPKVFGVETEYGIIVKGDERLNPVAASTLVVSSYRDLLSKSAEWDFDDEHPERDARGFVMPPDKAPTVEPSLTNVVLPNGARLYVDHAHPEYSTPECSDPLELVAHDAAGVLVMRKAVARLEATMDDGQTLRLYKNNSDGKGNSYGCHENYLVSRDVPFEDLAEKLVPYFVSRQVICGAGKVGAENGTEEAHFQISQRADFFEELIGLETTIRRPIINTRDEPHADPSLYRRLHVIVGDANMSQFANFVKIGATALVILMIEDGFIQKDLSLDDPVSALRAVSRDLTCRRPLRRSDGTTITPVELQWNYYELAEKWREGHDHPAWTPRVLDAWRQALEGLESDPFSLSDRLDWVAKLRVIESYRESRGLDWKDSKVAMIDLQYHDIREDRGIYWKLEQSGAIKRMVGDETIKGAELNPPETTRAYFRGRAIQHFGRAIVSANWDSVVVDSGKATLKRIPMMNPHKGTKSAVGQLFQQASDAEHLIELLSEG